MWTFTSHQLHFQLPAYPSIHWTAFPSSLAANMLTKQAKEKNQDLKNHTSLDNLRQHLITQTQRRDINRGTYSTVDKDHTQEYSTEPKSSQRTDWRVTALGSGLIYSKWDENCACDKSWSGSDGFFDKLNGRCSLTTAARQWRVNTPKAFEHQWSKLKHFAVFVSGIVQWCQYLIAWRLMTIFIINYPADHFLYRFNSEICCH